MFNLRTKTIISTLQNDSLLKMTTVANINIVFCSTKNKIILILILSESRLVSSAFCKFQQCDYEILLVLLTKNISIEIHRAANFRILSIKV